jgi:hypothetical protein
MDWRLVQVLRAAWLPKIADRWFFSYNIMHSFRICLVTRPSSVGTTPSYERSRI